MYLFELRFSLDIRSGMGLARLDGGSIFSFLRTLRAITAGWVHQITLPSTAEEGSLLSAPSPAFIVCGFF